MTHFRELLGEMSSKTKPTELKDVIAAKKNPADYWADDLLYNGKNLFEIYMKFYDDIASELEIGKSWNEPYEEYDDESGEYYEEDNQVTFEGQEVYLGYIPSKDMFVSGWDCWYRESNGGNDSASGLVFFQIKKEKFHSANTEVIDGSAMYSKRGGYEKLQKKFKDLENIRLD